MAENNAAGSISKLSVGWFATLVVGKALEMQISVPKSSPHISFVGDPAAWAKIWARTALDIVVITPKYLGNDGGYVDI